MLNENEWNTINDLTYRIFSTEDLREMCVQVMDTLEILIPTDARTFFLSDGKKFLDRPLVYGMAQEHVDRYANNMEDVDYKKWIFHSAQNKAFRMTDMLPENIRSVHPYYQWAYGKYRLHYEAILSLAAEKTFVGVVSLYRRKEHGDFSDRDMQVLEQIKNHLALRLYRSLHERNAPFGRRNPWLMTIATKYSLTERETEIVNLLQQGKENPEICEVLCISMSTLKKHLYNIYHKTGVNSKIRLLALLNESCGD
jgi:DNA-binding NarL/FixJ family response regulator